MSENINKTRLDQALVERGLFASRSRARDAVARGTVSVNGQVVTKAGQLVNNQTVLAVDDPASRFVSRAALKLTAALDHFGFDITGKTALDIGASTGGFTQVLLERGADHVICVDVGHDQLHESLRGDSRVTNLEGLNARGLDAGHLHNRHIDAVVSDVSFISLKLALPNALALCADGGWCLLLVKPQFEAGREAIGKGGLLKDPSLGEKIALELQDWLNNQAGWQALGFCASPITGGDGNQEYILAGRKEAFPEKLGTGSA
ncbi:TlyA family RNA methyltransferase [Pseudochrobactrum sp. MP213Fo]|uniref:TlyA family RNA methyltransferase n=1 Tax=Pseudochrobactrum sp. MP213Fo TaxID=3022250 RepID=UPI003B9E7C1B